MLRLRRYRVFLIFAVFTIAAFYHFSTARWDSDSPLNSHRTKPNDKIPTKARPKETQAAVNAPFPDESSEDPIPPATSATTERPLKPIKTVAPAIHSTTHASPITSTMLVPLVKPIPSKAAHPETDAHSPDSGEIRLPGQDAKDAADLDSGEGEGRLGATPPPSETSIRWSRFPEHFPIPTESLIHLPTGKAKIPSIQHDFSDETYLGRVQRERKQGAIRDAFKHAWAGYKDHAWMHDELSPVTGSFRDPFCGWAATLVDSLDTLWIMGLEDEFKEALDALKKIDFTKNDRNDIPVFETTIRYLGGLIAAYDVSGAKYRILLDKAVELAEVLMGAFDTPNRMPATFYHWKPAFASQPHRAPFRAVLSELGSLSVEFTRLAQLTKEHKYFDAVQRITKEFEKWQDKTSVPGLFPLFVDASGCKKSLDSSSDSQAAIAGPPVIPPAGGNLEEALKVGQELAANLAEEVGAADINGIPSTKTQLSTTEPIKSFAVPLLPSNSSASNVPFVKPPPIMMEPSISDAGKSVTGTKKAPASDAVAGKTGGHDLGWDSDDKKSPSEVKRQLADVSGGTGNVAVSSKNIPALHPPREIASAEPPSESPKVGSKEEDCEPQGLDSPPRWTKERFTLGAMADSLYEYLPKEYMLLGGQKEYRKMYEKAIEAAKKHLFFRPMTPTDRDILISGTLTVFPSGEHTFQPEGQHLGCFVGGMLAIGAKIFEREEDLAIGIKLTDGCVWAYESTTSHIMPETFYLVPCDDKKDCKWNETKWWDALDPGYEKRSASPTSDPKSHTKIPSGPQSQTETLHAPKAKREPLNGDSADEVGLDESLQATLTKQQLENKEVKSPDQQLNRPPNPEPLPEVPTLDKEPIYTPPPPPSHEDRAKQRIMQERLPKGFTLIDHPKYILRPEAIESVFILYRITGDVTWQTKGWNMFNAIMNATYTEFGNSGIEDVTSKIPEYRNEMESFWLAETLKYFYLLFSEPSKISLDDYVFNTEAHPFKRPKP